MGLTNKLTIPFVWPGAGTGREIARLPCTVVALVGLGRSRDRQADCPQTASVGVSTSKYVRNEGQVIRHNMGWTLVLLAYLILVGLLYYFLLPGLMR